MHEILTKRSTLASESRRRSYTYYTLDCNGTKRAQNLAITIFAPLFVLEQQQNGSEIAKENWQDFSSRIRGLYDTTSFVLTYK